MRTQTILVLLLLCLAFTGKALSQHLSRNVSLEYKNQTIRFILNDISKKHKVNFSYSDNVVPLDRKVSVSVKNKSLSHALMQLLDGTEVEFQEVASQVVLKKATTKAPVKAAEPEASPERQSAGIEPVPSRPVKLQTSSGPGMLPEPDYAAILQTENITRDGLRRQYLEERSKLRQRYYERLDSLETTSDTEAIEQLKGQFRRILGSLQRQVSSLSDSVETAQVRERHYKRGNRNGTAAYDSSGYYYSVVQATFVPPIGTNGLLGDQTVNGISFNFAGRAAGLDGVEFGLILNSERDFMYGAQFSGFINHVQGTVRGGQFSSFLNLSGGTLNGFQGAGFANIATGEVRAFQGSGYLNYAHRDVKGVQATGFLNIARGNFEGVQGAGYLNVATGNVRGVQAAGFMNVATDTLTGTQVSAFMNTAKIVHGSQFGIFNFADTVSGVQVGLLSVSRRGYRRLELSANETLHGNIAFKTGTRKFYNIFALGGRTSNSVVTWAYGYGFGTEQPLSRKFILTLDLLGHHVHRDGLQGRELNLLGQFKPTLGYLLTPRISLFAGPTANVFVSDTRRYRPVDAGSTSDAPSTLAPKHYLFSSTSRGVNVTGWVGITGGVRF